MNSNFFKMIGLGSVDVGYLFLALLIINLILLIMIVIAFLQISGFKKKYKKFMQGKNAGSLETDIMKLYEDNTFIKNQVEKNRKDIAELFNKQKLNFQKMGLVKYDAFKEMGGKLSFALVLLDENDNGILLNSVHSSEGCYSYTKRIKNGTSAIDLSNEEKVAVERAMQGTALNPDAE